MFKRRRIPMIITDKQFKILSKNLGKDFRVYFTTFLYDKDHQTVMVTDGHCLIQVGSKEFNCIEGGFKAQDLTFKTLDLTQMKKQSVGGFIDLDTIDEASDPLYAVPDIGRVTQDYLKPGIVSLNTFNPKYIQRTWDAVKAFGGSARVPPKWIGMNIALTMYSNLEEVYLLSIISRIVK